MTMTFPQEIAASTMRGDYVLFVFIVSLGVLQLAAAWAGLDGLSFFRRRYLGYIFAAVMVGVGYWWFFRIDRNIPDTAGGLSGPLLFSLLFAALIGAILVTLIISSVINARRSRSDLEDEHGGLDSLRSMTYLQAIRRGWRRNR